ncbi:unnamed protein product [Discosporangium mesarthrocarpum]
MVENIMMASRLQAEENKEDRRVGSVIHVVTWLMHVRRGTARPVATQDMVHLDARSRRLYQPDILSLRQELNPQASSQFWLRLRRGLMVLWSGLQIVVPHGT